MGYDWHQPSLKHISLLLSTKIFEISYMCKRLGFAIFGRRLSVSTVSIYWLLRRFVIIDGSHHIWKHTPAENIIIWISSFGNAKTSHNYKICVIAWLRLRVDNICWKRHWHGRPSSNVWFDFISKYLIRTSIMLSHWTRSHIMILIKGGQ